MRRGALREGRIPSRRIIGQSVFALSNGERQGAVRGLVYHPEEGRLIGFFVRARGAWLWLAERDTHALGEHAVTVPTPDVLAPLPVGVPPERSVAGGHRMLGKRLLTEGGTFLGRIADVLIERRSRRVVAYVVSAGLLPDLLRGQKDVPIRQIRAVGPDVAIVPDALQAEVEAATGGLLGTTEAARERVAGVIEDGERALQGRLRTFVRGKTAGREVADPAGGPLIRAGEVITEAHIARATETGQMHALAIAAGKTQAGEVADATGALAHLVREKVAAGRSAQVRLRTSVRERTADLSAAARERQARMLVGKTTAREVLDSDGRILVPAGRIVTGEDVTAVRAAGRLNDLTVSVQGRLRTSQERLRASGGAAWARGKDRAYLPLEDTDVNLSERLGKTPPGSEAHGAEGVPEQSTLAEPAQERLRASSDIGESAPVRAAQEEALPDAGAANNPAQDRLRPSTEPHAVRGRKGHGNQDG